MTITHKTPGAFLALVIIMSFSLVSFADEQKLIIVGGGHVGLVTALQAFLKAEKAGNKITITIFEKNARVDETTAANIWNSHTFDEIVSVVPRGQELEDKLKIPFNQPGGIRVDDVVGLNDSDSATRFKEQVGIDGANVSLHEKRERALLRLGRAGMMLWKELKDNAEGDFKALFEESNFNACCEPEGEFANQRFNGYRIDLIYDVPNAQCRAENMMKSYANLGSKKCEILTPDQVQTRDRHLSKFCDLHSDLQDGTRTWRDDSTALWRPGGCLDTQKFLPKLAEYLTKAMGNRFKLELNKEVSGLILENNGKEQKITGLKFADDTQFYEKNAHYALVPGEAVGTLHKLGLKEPAYAGFAGASLSLSVPISEAQLKEFADFNHYMEVHKIGVVLAWQARLRDGMIFLGGAGTKSFYGDVKPNVNDEFARTNNLLQLQMFNDVLPQVVSIALGEDTTNMTMTHEHMKKLEKNGIAKRWVGIRAVNYTGFPIAGHVYAEDKKISNAHTTTHLGSGGGSFSLIMSLISNYAVDPDAYRDDLIRLGLDEEFVHEVLSYADTRIVAEKL